MYELPKFVQRKMFTGEAQSLSFQLVQCFQLMLDLFMLSRTRYSRWSLEGLRHVSLPAVRPWLSSLQIFLTPCPHVRRFFFFKAFQPLLVIYLHTVVLETLILLKVEFFLPFCLVEFFYALGIYLQLFREHLPHICKITAIISLVCLLKFLLLTTCSLISFRL